MSMIIDGKKIAETVNCETAQFVNEMKKNHDLKPGLVVIIVGDDPASHVYVKMKIKACEKVGIHSICKRLPKETTQDELLAMINDLNNDPNIHGILVQSPPPKHIDEATIIAAINPAKDVDCFHVENVGKMLTGDSSGFLPCTPHGVMQLLRRSDVDPEGKHVVIVGRSNIVGKPMMALLVQKAAGANATVTVCHSRTPNISEFTQKADILIAAIGKPEFIKGDMVKDGAVVIDVGVNRIEDSSKKSGYRLVGDVAFEEVVDKAAKITPVPGGVGPMTIAMLMHNTVKACCLINNIPTPK
jgi:methylenetetrahydrofolate dehydrogenase (NADP+)/methenyltetrahydrofolate cyclohydrolase